MGYLQIKKRVRMAIRHASKGPKRDISVGTFRYTEAMKLNLSEKMWTAANAVTMFSVVQALAYLYSASKIDMQLQIMGMNIVPVFIVIFHIGYIWAVCCCHKTFKELAEKSNNDQDQVKKVSNMVRNGQCIMIFALGLIAFVVTFRIS